MRLPKERMLHTIDVATPGRVAFRNLPGFYPQDWIAAPHKLRRRELDRRIPGPLLPLRHLRQASKMSYCCERRRMNPASAY